MRKVDSGHLETMNAPNVRPEDLCIQCDRPVVTRVRSEDHPAMDWLTYPPHFFCKGPGHTGRVHEKCGEAHLSEHHQAT